MMIRFLELTDGMNINEQTRMSAFMSLVRKIFNAHVGAPLQFYKSMKINRQTDGEDNAALTEEIK